MEDKRAVRLPTKVTDEVSRLIDDEYQNNRETCASKNEKDYT